MGQKTKKKSNINANPNIVKQQSHSEQTLSPTSERYECFYLFDNNNKEESIIDEKKCNQIDNSLIHNHFQSYNLNSDSEYNDNCFYLFNDYQDSSHEEYETNIQSK